MQSFKVSVYETQRGNEAERERERDGGRQCKAGGRQAGAALKLIRCGIN